MNSVGIHAKEEDKTHASKLSQTNTSAQEVHYEYMNT